MEALLAKGEYKPILESLLTAKGLDLANVPKGLIKFHSYPGHTRTPFEEHLVEGAAYTKDRNGGVRIHFTVSPEHETSVRSHIESTRALYEKGGVTFSVEFSSQKASTDTIAVDMDNQPFRDRDGALVFRPGGHGSLLENLCDLSGDILFIKNIDNVLPDRLKQETITYKKALGGLLIDLQKKIFAYVEKLMSGEVDQRLLTEMIGFMKDRLFIMIPDRLETTIPGGASSFSYFQAQQAVASLRHGQERGRAGRRALLGGAPGRNLFASDCGILSSGPGIAPAKEDPRIFDPLQSGGSCLRYSGSQRKTF